MGGQIWPPFLFYDVEVIQNQMPDFSAIFSDYFEGCNFVWKNEQVIYKNLLIVVVPLKYQDHIIHVWGAFE